MRVTPAPARRTASIASSDSVRVGIPGAPRATVAAAWLLLSAGSEASPPTVAVAVLTTGPGPVETVAWIWYVTEPPAGMLARSLMLPAPLAVQVAPGVAVQVHVAPVRAAGSVSVMVTPTASLGPRLLTVTVNPIGPPMLANGLEDVLVTRRSVDGRTTVSASVALSFAGLTSRGEVTV